MTDLVFGIHAVSEVLSQRNRVEVVYLQDNYKTNKKLQQIWNSIRQANIPFETYRKQEMDALCHGGNHQGIIARVVGADRQLSEKLLEEYLVNIKGSKFVLVLDQIQDPHNLGACLRTAAAAGVHVVIAPKDGAAPITPVVRKTACGATQRIPYVQVTNLARTLKSLQKMGIWITGTDVETGSTPYDIDFTGDIAIVIGSEGKGLRRLVKENCDYLVHIPMPGKFESLNASVATGVMLFEVVRQRRFT